LVKSPSIVWLPLPSNVIVPLPLFFITYILPEIPTAVGNVMVNVPDVASIK